MAFAKLAAEVWRNFVTDGVATSGKWRPRKDEVRAWGGEVETQLAAHTAVDAELETGKQPLADNLTKVAALVPEADRVPYMTGVVEGKATWGKLHVTPYMRGLLDDGNAGSARTTLQLGPLATQTDTLGIAQGGTGVTTLAALRGIAVPAGTGAIWYGTNPPADWFECDGRLLSRTEEADLFAAIGARYGSTSGSNFRLPDMRGYFPRGWDHGGGLDSGRALGSKQGDTIRNIVGEFGLRTLSTGADSGPWAVRTVSNSNIRGVVTGENTHAIINFDASRQVPTADENRPLNLAVMFIIHR